MSCGKLLRRFRRLDGPVDPRRLRQCRRLGRLADEPLGWAPTSRYGAKLQVLLQVFRLHVRGEEALILPEVRRRLSPSDREQLGRSLMERTGQLTGRSRGGW
jgi:hypothetical protein